MSWPTTWHGFDVLTIEPNRSGPLDDELERRFALLDPQVGIRQPDERTPAPAPVRAFRWTAFSRQEVAVMRAFLDARKGRRVPFWLPSWQQDLRLAANVLAAQTVISAVWIGYTAQMFGTTEGRRHLASFAVNRDASYHHVTDANDPQDLVTESLTIAPGAGVDWAASTTILSFLRFSRLEDDEVEITWHGPHTAEAILRVREIPHEAPA